MENNSNYAKWQEKTRKDVERSFGVLQSEFRILMQKVELWSIEDIVSVVDCCLLLHSWMVTVRLSRDESESNEWYDVTGDSGEQNGDRRDNGDGDLRGNDENNRQATKMLQRVVETIILPLATFSSIMPLIRDTPNTSQQACLRTRENLLNDRWMHLYDAENFYRLQNAIINELQKINWNFDLSFH
jgi:hypothetical protein